MTRTWVLASNQARKVDDLNKKLNDEKQKLDAFLKEIAEEAKQYGYTLWKREDGTYFWENRHKRIANYPTLSEAIVAYGSETIDFS